MKESENFFDVQDNGEVFYINFHTIFDKPGLEEYSAFNMKAKRNFKNCTKLIKETYEELFLENGRVNEKNSIILYKILNLQYKILITESMSFAEFQKELNELTDSDDGFLLKVITDYVNSNYALTLDKLTEESKAKSKKINTALQFSDKHGKALLRISYLYRVIMPIISQYFNENKELFNKQNIKEMEDSDGDDEFGIDEANSTLFAILFDKLSGNTNALKNKLYKLVYSRISKTIYSDKRFWTLAKNYGITKDTETLDIYKKLLVNAIPKLSLDADKNIISFFQSVINNQIDFLLQNKFKFKFVTLNPTLENYSNDDDDVTEFEKLEIQMLRKDEGLFKLRQLNIRETIPKIEKELGVTVTNQEVVDLQRKLQRNTIQERLVAIITLKYFEDKDVLNFLTFSQYCRLVAISHKYLELHKFVILSQIIVANCKKHRERTMISGKRIKPLIQVSKFYTELFTRKYNNFTEEIEKPINAIIATAYSSMFVDDNGKELFDSSVKVGKIAEELIDLVYIC